MSFLVLNIGGRGKLLLHLLYLIWISYNRNWWEGLFGKGKKSKVRKKEMVFHLLALLTHITADILCVKENHTKKEAN